MASSLINILKKSKRRLRAITQKNGPDDLTLLREGPKTKFVFIHINKTGGTSVGRALGIQPKQHFTAQEVIHKIGQQHWNEAFTFTIVRNPWDKVVSHYRYRVKTNQNKMKDLPIPFEEWVRKTYGKDKDPVYYNNPKMFLPQMDWISDKSGKICVDFVGRLEQIEDDFAHIISMIGIEAVLQHYNKTSGKPYQEYYSPETKMIISNWFEKDIEAFQYSFFD